MSHSRGIVFQEALFIVRIAESWAHSSLECPDIVEAGRARNNGKKQTKAETFKVVGMDSVHSSQGIRLLDARMTLNWYALRAPLELLAAVPSIVAWHVTVQHGSGEVVMFAEVEGGSQGGDRTCLYSGVDMFCSEIDSLAILQMDAQSEHGRVALVYWEFQDAPNCFVTGDVTAHFVARDLIPLGAMLFQSKHCLIRHFVDVLADVLI